MPERRALPAEALAVLALVAVVTLALTATYARIPAAQLYHVSHGGLRGGLSRALVLLDFPFALVAPPLAAIAFDRLRGSGASALAALATVLAAVVAWPGVVDQANLDAKPVNAVPALGLGLAAALTLVAAARRAGGFVRRLRLDPGRLVLALCLTVVSLPWLAAELGFSISDVPLAGRVFLGDQIRAGSAGETPVVVHLGHHHGADGLYLALAALLLTRALPLQRRLRRLLSAYLALLLAYGVANLVQDLWTEQVVKRGWTHDELPSMLHPSLSLAWLAILLAGAAIELGALRRESGPKRGPAPRPALVR
ncbi:MAG: hypothetical protein ACXVY8_06270 [Gaiellaceae bacterium]